MPARDNIASFYSARPEIRIDDRKESELTDGLLSLLVEETTDGLYRCEATFGNWGSTDGGVGFLYLDRRLLDFGKTFSVVAGSEDANKQIFKGRITGLEGRYPTGMPAEITVLAEDRFQDLRMTRRTRTFEDLSDSDVISQIASEHGLQAVVDVTGPTHAVLAQLNQSDLAFLRERARAVDAELWMDDATLHAQARSRRNVSQATLKHGERLFAFSGLADAAMQRTGFVVAGWDTSAKEGIEHEAAASVIQSELNGYTSGVDILQSAFGARVERMVHAVPFTTDEARVVAEARFRSVARQFVTGHGIAEGDGRIRAGTQLTLEKLGTMFDGIYYVTAVKHVFDNENGFRTRFRVERPGIIS